MFAMAHVLSPYRITRTICRSAKHISHVTDSPLCIVVLMATGSMCLCFVFSILFQPMYCHLVSYPIVPTCFCWPFDYLCMLMVRCFFFLLRSLANQYYFLVSAILKFFFISAFLCSLVMDIVVIIWSVCNLSSVIEKPTLTSILAH